MKIVWTTSSPGIGGFPEEWDVILNPYGRRLSEDDALEFLTRENLSG